MARHFLGIIILIMDTHSLWCGTDVPLVLVFDANFGQFLVQVFGDIIDFMVNRGGSNSYIGVHTFIVLLVVLKYGSRYRPIVLHG